MKRGDIAVAIALLALAGGLLLLRGNSAGEIFVNGEQASQSMQINEVFIEIEGNRARIAHSPCRDQLCMRAGWLERGGDTAVCLPQRVIVEIRGARRGVDCVAY